MLPMIKNKPRKANFNTAQADYQRYYNLYAKTPLPNNSW
jgi:hypothetical protein